MHSAFLLMLTILFYACGKQWFQRDEVFALAAYIASAISALLCLVLAPAPVQILLEIALIVGWQLKINR